MSVLDFFFISFAMLHSYVCIRNSWARFQLEIECWSFVAINFELRILTWECSPTHLPIPNYNYVSNLVSGTCDPDKCRLRCAFQINPEQQITLCNRFWRRHQTMVSRHEYLDKVVKTVGVKRRKSDSDPTKQATYKYRLYPDKKKTQVSTHHVLYYIPHVLHFIALSYNRTLPGGYIFYHVT